MYSTTAARRNMTSRCGAQVLRNGFYICCSPRYRNILSYTTNKSLGRKLQQTNKTNSATLVRKRTTRVPDVETVTQGFHCASALWRHLPPDSCLSATFVVTGSPLVCARVKHGQVWNYVVDTVIQIFRRSEFVEMKHVWNRYIISQILKLQRS
jgi:hypothetical protein